MQTKKIRDIIPPRRVERERVEEKRSTPRFKGLFAVAAFLIVLAGAAGVLALHFIFAKAEVSIWPKTREVALKNASWRSQEKEPWTLKQR